MFVKRLLVVSVFVPFIISCSSENQETTTDAQEAETVSSSVPSIEVVETETSRSQPVEIDYSHVVYEITEKGYPGTYAKWGKEWIDDINRMMPLAVQRVASNPKCDAPETADLSDNRSSPKQEAVFYVDCRNGERFYISQNELTDTTQIEAESEVLSGEPSDYIKPCQEMVKAQLNYPSSFDADIGTSAFKGTSGNIVVEMSFTAKNALGAELPQAARCVFGTNGENEAVITNR